MKTYFISYVIAKNIPFTSDQIQYACMDIDPTGLKDSFNWLMAIKNELSRTEDVRIISISAL